MAAFQFGASRAGECVRLGRHDLEPLILSAEECAGCFLCTLQAVVRTPAALLFVGRGYLGSGEDIVERAFYLSLIHI